MRDDRVGGQLGHALDAQDRDDLGVGQGRADGLPERRRVDRHAVAVSCGQPHRAVALEDLEVGDAGAVEDREVDRLAESVAHSLHQRSRPLAQQLEVARMRGDGTQALAGSRR